MRAAESIIRDIESFSPTGGDWRPLDELLAELWEAGVLKEHLRSLFRVFERYPEEDGSGVLWSIIHGVESLAFDYEEPLRDSLRRQASMMGSVLLRRLENSRAA